MFNFDLQLFAKVDNPYSLKGNDLDYKNPNYISYMENPLYPEGSLTIDPDIRDKRLIKDGALSYWFKNKIPDINSISSLYDSISSNKNYFDEKIVVTDNIDNLFSGISFTNMDEINAILPKIFLGNKNTYLNTVKINYIYDGINMFETTDNKYKIIFPNNFKLKPKLLNGFISQYLYNNRDTYSLFGGAFVKTLDISEFNLLPKSDTNNQYNPNSNPGNDIYGMFKNCIAQSIVGLDKFPFEKFKYCGDYMFAGAFNLDKYIDKIEDPDTKKKLKKAYYNAIEAIDLADSYYDTNEVDLDKVLFEYWIKPLKLKKDSFGIGYKISSTFLPSGGHSITATFKEAYINCVDLSNINLTNYTYIMDMFKNASVSTIIFNTIGSKEPQSQCMPNYSNLFNVAKNGPFKLREIRGTIIFPDEKYMKISYREPDPPESGIIKADRLKNMLPSKEALAPEVTNIGITFKNYNKEALLKFVQEHGRPEITTEDQLFEFFGLPKSYIRIDPDTEVPQKPADFDTNPYSDEAVAYMKYNSIHMEVPDDLETNVYGDPSVAFRKLYNLPLPKPADFDTNMYSHEADVYAKFYNIGRPSQK